MDREVFLVLDNAIVWSGVVAGAQNKGVLSAREYFAEAWRRALQDGAVAAEDASEVQFRFTRP